MERWDANAACNPLSGKRVAVVEDHGLIARVLLLELRRRGANAQRTELTTQALAWLPLWQPHVAVVDLHLGDDLPGGIDLLPELRSVGTEALVLTAEKDPAVHQRCLDAGAAAVLVKTSSVDRILLLLEQLAAG